MADKKSTDRDAAAPRLALTLRQAASATTFSPSYVRRLVAEGRFPRPRRAGRRVIFLASEIEGYLAGLPAAPAELSKNGASQ